jgi:murein DD-endopeptidase MepM/ murein hydrolase activator NlpD
LDYGWPVLLGNVSSAYGYRTDVLESPFHTGIDISAPAGTAIYAMDGGVVIAINCDPSGSYGKFVSVLSSDRTIIIYAHIEGDYVSLNQTVGKGQVIASVGSNGKSSGPHVHAEIVKNGEQIDPIPQMETGPAGVGLEGCVMESDGTLINKMTALPADVDIDLYNETCAYMDANGY